MHGISTYFKLIQDILISFGFGSTILLWILLWMFQLFHELTDGANFCLFEFFLALNYLKTVFNTVKFLNNTK